MFTLDDDQLTKLEAWRVEQDLKAATQQRAAREAAGGPPRPDSMYPNYGAIGGAYTFSFTPTGLGVVVTVKNGVTKDEIDLSEYSNW